MKSRKQEKLDILQQAYDIVDADVSDSVYRGYVLTKFREVMGRWDEVDMPVYVYAPELYLAQQIIAQH